MPAMRQIPDNLLRTPLNSRGITSRWRLQLARNYGTPLLRAHRYDTTGSYYNFTLAIKGHSVLLHGVRSMRWAPGKTNSWGLYLVQVKESRRGIDCLSKVAG